MTPEQWEKITDLYHEASELEGRERREFLDNACDDDVALRREVESLLAADANAGDFISSPAVDSIESWSGQFVAHYQIMSRIGSGGMGEVYLAKDTKLNRMVALKTLPRLLSDQPDYLRRFENEARSAAAMNHPNVAVVYSVEEAGRSKFITMEYVEGKTLDEFIHPDGLDLKTFLEWFIPITDALAHAHEKGIVHRDIKPGNVMITTSRTPKVLDFGLAQTVPQKIHGSDGPAVRKEEVIGTPAYMSPEQARGAGVDFRSDIFSIGVLMYEALTGERPFKGDSNAAVIGEVLSHDPRPLSRANRHVPNELSDLITRCLNKDPRKRPVLMEWVRDILESISMSEFGFSADGLSIVSPWQRRRRPWAVAYGFAGLAALVLLGFAVYWFATNTPSASFSFNNISQRRLSQTNNVLFAQITPDGNSYIYSTNEPDDERALWIRRIAENEAVHLVPPGPVSFWGGFTTTPDSGHAYYISADRDARHGTLYRISTLGGEPQKIAETVNDVGNVSPDGSRVLYVRYGANVLLLSANAEDGSDERIILRADPNEIFRDPHFSHDGKSIYVIRIARTQGVELWSLEEIGLDGAVQRFIITPRKHRISEVAALSDGSGLLVNAVEPVSNLTQISHLSLKNGTQTRITNDLNAYFGLSVSADGSRIVTTQRNDFKDIWVGNGQDVSTYKKVTTESTVNLRVSWTPDGRLVYDAVDNNRPHIRIVNADGSGMQQLTPAGTSDFEPRVSPDGRYIVFTSERSGERKIWRINTDGSEPVMLTPVEGSAGAPMIAPDGENVYFIWTKNEAKSLGVVPMIGGPVVEKPLFSETYAAISPDGKQVASAFYTDADKRYYVAIRPIDRDEPTTVFNIAPTWFMSWPKGADGLFYRELEPGTETSSTVAFQPISGGEPRSYLSVAPDLIFDFALAPDGKRAAIIRGRLATNAVLLSVNPAR